MPRHRSQILDTSGATAQDVLDLAATNNVRFLRLQFTDILGINKNVEIPASQFEKAVAGDIMFDGSSIEGFVRIEESDMLLAPDFSTFQIYPWGDEKSRVARLICDINTPDGQPFPGDPRGVLKKMIARAAKLGYTMNAGMEAEFFMFKPGPDEEPSTVTHDVGSYFDLAPADLGEDARRAIVDVLERMGFEVEAAHHEVAHGQHEIDFRYAEALKTADNITTFRFVVKYVARTFGLTASFMPKPIFGQNGSGMHTHQSLFRGKENAFWDEKSEWELSSTALHYIGGLLRHARGFTAITNPLVNSYKRLVPDGCESTICPTTWGKPAPSSRRTMSSPKPWVSTSRRSFWRRSASNGRSTSPRCPSGSSTITSPSINGSCSCGRHACGEPWRLSFALPRGQWLSPACGS